MYCLWKRAVEQVYQGSFKLRDAEGKLFTVVRGCNIQYSSQKMDLSVIWTPQVQMKYLKIRSKHCITFT